MDWPEDYGFDIVEVLPDSHEFDDYELWPFDYECEEAA